MDRKAYNNCMIPYMKGTGKSNEERKLRFCTGSKLCSSKAKTEEEAIALCKLPKPEKEPKSPKTRRGSKANCETDMANVAQCLVGNISSSTTADEIIKILVKCHCKKNPTRIYTGDLAGAPVADEKLNKEKEETLALIAKMRSEYGTG